MTICLLPIFAPENFVCTKVNHLLKPKLLNFNASRTYQLATRSGYWEKGYWEQEQTMLTSKMYPSLLLVIYGNNLGI